MQPTLNSKRNRPPHWSIKFTRGANSKIKICNGILTKFKLIQTLIVVLIVCKNEEDPFKIESIRVVAIFLPLKVYRDFSNCSRAGNSYAPDLILLNFKPIRDIMGSLVACKIEEDPIKNE